ncbi:hypothetical protein ACJ6WF_35680 [Streptomyces sp. MMS24-I2-30]|uniref:hypothetical protein n=1 Tax=Streptomyces sp. MMS24-I2-30 TaxID=3351564 RepID=UPI003896D16A
MTSGNGAEPAGEEPAADSVDGPQKGHGDDSDDGAEPAAGPATGAERTRTSRRKAGVEYRPV